MCDPGVRTEEQHHHISNACRIHDLEFGLIPRADIHVDWDFYGTAALRNWGHNFNVGNGIFVFCSIEFFVHTYGQQGAAYGTASGDLRSRSRNPDRVGRNESR